MESLNNPQAAGRMIRGRRREMGMSQAQLAERAGVSRKFVASFESGHERAELGKFMMLASALDWSITMTPAERPAGRWSLDDVARDIRRELHAGDPEFAMRILADAIQHLRSAQKLPAPLQPPSTGSTKWDTLLAASVRYAYRLREEEAPAWTRARPLRREWFPYDFRPLSEPWKNLSREQTPRELSEAGISIRERSLTSA